MLVFLTEEQSMTPVLRKLLAGLWPSALEGLHWHIIHHQGKADLESNLVDKMRSWNYNSPHFIILRDNDGGDCQALKNRLLDLATSTSKPHHIRIVCQELEAWFLGDLEAVEAAFPKSDATSYQNRNPYRFPDKPTHPSQLIAELTGTSAKVGRAEEIAPHLNSETNRSPSFQVLRRTLLQLIPSHS